MRHDAVGKPGAAPAGKGKGLGKGRTDLVGKCLLDEIAGAVETGLHRLGIQLEQFRRFLRAQALDGSGNQHGAKIVRQLIDSPLQKLADLVLGHGTLRID